MGKLISTSLLLSSKQFNLSIRYLILLQPISEKSPPLLIIINFIKDWKQYLKVTFLLEFLRQLLWSTITFIFLIWSFEDISLCTFWEKYFSTYSFIGQKMFAMPFITFSPWEFIEKLFIFTKMMKIKDGEERRYVFLKSRITKKLEPDIKSWC